MTFGYSRDDAEGGFLLKYVEDGILPVNPFQTLDDAVAGLMKIAVDKGRATRPDLELGICGEHGGDPESIHKCERIGLDYVSCSPFRVPVARLAAAQAVLAGRRARQVAPTVVTEPAGPPRWDPDDRGIGVARRSRPPRDARCHARRRRPRSRLGRRVTRRPPAAAPRRHAPRGVSPVRVDTSERPTPDGAFELRRSLGRAGRRRSSARSAPRRIAIDRGRGRGDDTRPRVARCGR